MKTKEVIQLTGLSKKAIYHYIEKGLIVPEIEENNYYSFTMENVNALKYIKFLRDMDMPISEIEELNKNPAAFMIFISRLKANVYRQKSILQEQFEKLTDIEESLLHGDSMNDIFEKFSQPVISQHNTSALNENDAKFIFYHFFGNFMQDIEMTEYKYYLIERIIKQIVAEQNDQILRFRDYLLTVEPEMLQYEFLQAKQMDGMILFSGFENKECIPTARDSISVIKEHLINSEWVKGWKMAYKGYIKPKNYYYGTDDKLNELMFELSPEYKTIMVNIHHYCDCMYKYINSDEGFWLKKLIDLKLGDYIDYEMKYHVELSYLYTLDKDMDLLLKRYLRA